MAAAAAASFVLPVAAGGIQVPAPGEGETTTVVAVLPGFQAGGAPAETEVTVVGRVVVGRVVVGRIVVVGGRPVVPDERWDVAAGRDVTAGAPLSARVFGRVVAAVRVGAELVELTAAGIAGTVGSVGGGPGRDVATVTPGVSDVPRATPPVSVALQLPASSAATTRPTAPGTVAAERRDLVVRCALRVLAAPAMSAPVVVE